MRDEDDRASRPIIALLRDSNDYDLSLATTGSDEGGGGRKN